MRVRLFQAFASNNSGSYTLVGRFPDESRAGEAAAALGAMCAAHSTWCEAAGHAGSLAESPLAAFAREHGLVGVPAELDDHWPEHGPPPSVVHVGPQVLVLVPYTVTMPRALGEYIYRSGGRVDLEIDHGHDPLAAEVSLWAPGGHADQAARDRVEAVRARIDTELPALTARAAYDTRPVIAPAWFRGDWGQLHLAAEFTDAAAGVLRVRELCRDAGVEVHVRIFEISRRDPDPFAARRGDGRHAPGRYRVALWSAGASRVAVMKVVRALLGCGLDAARVHVGELPKELLLGVSRDAAEDAVRRLREVGADAEAFAPDPSG